MVLFKKLIFALPFLACLLAFTHQLWPILENMNLLFSFDQTVLLQTLNLLILLIFSCFFLVIFVTLSQDFKIIMPVLVLSCLLLLVLRQDQYSFLLVIGFLAALTIASLLHLQKLKSYFTFKATALLIPSIRLTVMFLTIISSLIFYLITDTQIKEKGFIIPEAILDISLKFSGVGEELSSSTPEIPQLPPEQIQLLKQNPQLLKQYGLDVSILDSFDNQGNYIKKSTNQKSPTQSIIKEMVQSQFQNMIKPYLPIIPIFLAVLFYIGISSLASLLLIFVYPLTSLIFLILEKSGFTRYEEETRIVKKLVV